MNRSTAAATAVAAVLGITGGTWLGATVGADDPRADDPDETVSPSSTRTGRKSPTTSPAAQSPAQLLYMDATTIHDGYTHIDVEDIDLSTITDLVRIRGGWLIIEREAANAPEFDASTVDVTGERTDLGSFTGGWDISEDGDRFVALRGHDYSVYDLVNGEWLDMEVEGPEDTQPTGDATFTLAAVLTGWANDDGERRSLRTDLATGRSRLVPTGTLTGWTASPRGLLIAGRVSNGAITCLRGGALSDAESWWTACDWALDESRAKYSPNGEQLLVVPLDPDGGPPQTYGVLGSGTGQLIDLIDAPKLALDAEWGDNNELFVLAQKSPRNPAGVIYRCQVRGECVPERPTTTRLVLGAGT